MYLTLLPYRLLIQKGLFWINYKLFPEASWVSRQIIYFGPFLIVIIREFTKSMYKEPKSNELLSFHYP